MEMSSLEECPHCEKIDHGRPCEGGVERTVLWRERRMRKGAGMVRHRDHNHPAHLSWHLAAIHIEFH